MMKSRVRKTLLAASALLLAVPTLFAGLAWWFEWGPGFRRQCDRLVTVAGIAPGMTVADIGAGAGGIAVRIAARLGPSGHLYATELFESHLEAIRNRAAAAGLANITTIHAAVDATGLPAACCDVIYMRRVYHHLEDPTAIAASIRSSLRPGGRFVVIDMLTPRWIPLSFQHGIPSGDIRAGLESAGFQLERRFEWWSPVDYCLIFRKGPGSSSMHRVESLPQRVEYAVGGQIP
jgi:SAM-dependent methyltransferase